MVKKIDQERVSGKPGLGRRTVLAGLAASALAAPSLIRRASAQMVIRRPTDSYEPRYNKYAQLGPLTGGENGKIITIPDLGFKAAVHVPRAPDARLVVFSHGAAADPQIYRPLLSQWASHGFAVVAPIHDDSVIERGLGGFEADMNSGKAEFDISRLLGDADAWEQRATMCSDILNAIPTLVRLLGVRMSKETVIIAGHDYGAYVAQLLIGMTAKGDKGRVIKQPDPRYTAGMMLSPQGIGVMGLTEKSWENITVPYMAAVAGREVDANKQDQTRKTDCYTYASGQYKHLALEPEGNAQWFTGQSAGINDLQRDMFDDLKGVTTAFLKAYGARDEQAFKDLYSDMFGIASNRRLDLRSR